MSLTDKEVNHLESLRDTQTLSSVKEEDNLNVKLLYILLEEMVVIRKEAKQTKKLLIEIADALKITNKHLSQLAKTTMIVNRDGQMALRTHEYKD